MDMGIAWGLAVAGLAAGVAIGWMLARTRGMAALNERAERAEQALKEERSRAQAAVAAAEASAKRDVAAIQAEMASRTERLNAEHRAETEKLARHLTEAYDELDGLRAKADAARHQQPGDTAHGFAATLPLSQL
jgi:uncharacterized membrane-anchored protein YhcB (DUF1043 family)